MDNDRLGICEDMEELAVLYHYGELTAEKRAKVEAHLAVCAHCADTVAQTARVLGMIRPETPSPEDTRRAAGRVMARIAVRRRPFLLRLAPALAAAAVAAGVIAYSLTGTGPEVKPRVAARAPVVAQEASAARQAVAEPQYVPPPAELELMENYEVLAELDLIEEMETLDRMEEL